MPRRIGIEVKRKDSELERAWDFHFAALCPDLAKPLCNYRFDARGGSAFELDRAFVAERVGVEIQGGTWHKGAHSSGAGLNRDYRKANIAAVNDWVILYVDGTMLRRNPQAAFDQLRVVLGLRRIPFTDSEPRATEWVTDDADVNAIKRTSRRWHGRGGGNPS